jgi:hypothetical protein
MTGTGRKDKKAEESSGRGNEAKREGAPNEDSSGGNSSGDNSEGSSGDNSEGSPGDNSESSPGDNSESSPGDNSEDSSGGDVEDNNGSQRVETNNNQSFTLTSSLRLASGAPDDDPVEKPDPKNIHFEVPFIIRHIDRRDQEIFKQTIRVEGTLQSEVILFIALSVRYDYYPL